MLAKHGLHSRNKNDVCVKYTTSQQCCIMASVILLISSSLLSSALLSMHMSLTCHARYIVKDYCVRKMEK